MSIDLTLVGYIKLLLEEGTSCPDAIYSKSLEDGTLLVLKKLKGNFCLYIHCGPGDPLPPGIIIKQKTYPDLYKKCCKMEKKSYESNLNR